MGMNRDSNQEATAYRRKKVTSLSDAIDSSNEMWTENWSLDLIMCSSLVILVSIVLLMKIQKFHREIEEWK